MSAKHEALQRELERKGIPWNLIFGYDLGTLLPTAAAGAVVGGAVGVLTSTVVGALVRALRGKKGVLQDAFAKVSQAADMVREAGNRALADQLDRSAARLQEELAEMDNAIGAVEDAEVDDDKADASDLERKFFGGIENFLQLLAIGLVAGPIAHAIYRAAYSVFGPEVERLADERRDLEDERARLERASLEDSNDSRMHEIDARLRAIDVRLDEIKDRVEELAEEADTDKSFTELYIKATVDHHKRKCALFEQKAFLVDDMLDFLQDNTDRFARWIARMIGDPVPGDPLANGGDSAQQRQAEAQREAWQDDLQALERIRDQGADFRRGVDQMKEALAKVDARITELTMELANRPSAHDMAPDDRDELRRQIVMAHDAREALVREMDKTHDLVQKLYEEARAISDRISTGPRDLGKSASPLETKATWLDVLQGLGIFLGISVSLGAAVEAGAFATHKLATAAFDKIMALFGQTERILRDRIEETRRKKEEAQGWARTYAGDLKDLQAQLAEVRRGKEAVEEQEPVDDDDKHVEEEIEIKAGAAHAYYYGEQSVKLWQDVVGPLTPTWGPILQGVVVTVLGAAATGLAHAAVGVGYRLGRDALRAVADLFRRAEREIEVEIEHKERALADLHAKEAALEADLDFLRDKMDDLIKAREEAQEEANSKAEAEPFHVKHSDDYEPVSDDLLQREAERVMGEMERLVDEAIRAGDTVALEAIREQVSYGVTDGLTPGRRGEDMMDRIDAALAGKSAPPARAKEASAFDMKSALDMIDEVLRDAPGPAAFYEYEPAA